MSTRRPPISIFTYMQMQIFAQSLIMDGEEETQNQIINMIPKDNVKVFSSKLWTRIINYMLSLDIINSSMESLYL